MQVVFVESDIVILPDDEILMKTPLNSGLLRLKEVEADHYVSKKHFALCGDESGRPVSSGLRFDTFDHFLKWVKSRQKDDARLGTTGYPLFVNGKSVNFFSKISVDSYHSKSSDQAKPVRETILSDLTDQQLLAEVQKRGLGSHAKNDVIEANVVVRQGQVTAVFAKNHKSSLEVWDDESAESLEADMPGFESKFEEALDAAKKGMTFGDVWSVADGLFDELQNSQSTKTLEDAVDGLKKGHVGPELK